LNNRRAAIAGLLLFVLLPLVAAGLDLLAKKTRGTPPVGNSRLKVIAVANARDIWQTYAGLGLRGRLLLHVGRHLHFVEISANEIYRLDQGDLSRLDLKAAYLQRVNHRNYLWIAARAGMFRKIHYLLDEGAFREKQAEAGISAAEEFSVSDSGFPRVISVKPLAGSEPPVVQIDAAWLEGHTAEETLSLLGKLPVKPDTVILSAAEDNPERTALARERIVKLKGLISDSGQ
jgi:hypothetical protein